MDDLDIQNGSLLNDIKKIYEQQYKSDEEINEVNEEEIDINDYVLAEEENEFGEFVALLNIYTCYFKQVFRREQDESMFDHIDYDQRDSTNKCLELLYEEINKFTKSEESDKDLLYNPDDESIDINKCQELYVLYINNFPGYACKYILPLMRHLAKIDWSNMEWSIIPVKNT
ncbi:hypothetical protein Indivirus_1_68 [Indivirus ILV1]|uniref:Uncharacterized protein n=1 Tax=Indivirus ILV1 TaxID=1977633 RepID=A0A1V0SCL0_9VIRU|nr:hypothetical protein Indivirus_1_68 [Indivirus ILV1]